MKSKEETRVIMAIAHALAVMRQYGVRMGRFMCRGWHWIAIELARRA